MKMGDMISDKMLAPCGVNCLFCSAHLSKKNACPGCRVPEELITRKSCRNCKKKQCVLDKGLQWCFQCSEFPCAKIVGLNKRYIKNYDINLIQNGLDANKDMDLFLQTQKNIFTCKKCSGIIDQHYKKCSDCGRSFE